MKGMDYVLDARSGCWHLPSAQYPVNALPATTTDPAMFSARHPLRVPMAKLNAFFADAALEYAKGAGANFTLVRIGDGHYAMEQEYGLTKNVLVADYSTNGLIQAAIKKPSGWTPVPNWNDAFKTGGVPHTGLYAMLLVACAEKLQSSDLGASIQELKQLVPGMLEQDGSIKQADENATKLATYLYKISDEFSVISKMDECALTLPGGVVSKLEENLINGTTLTGERLCGAPPTYIHEEEAVSTGEWVTIAQAKSEFAGFRASIGDIPEEDKVFIPEFPDDFLVPEEALKIARRYIGTRDAKNPMVNFFWRGITAYGKSTGVEVLACLLGLPLMRVTCSSNMEQQTFLANFVPDNDAGGSAIPKAVPTPQYWDMDCDPAAVYATYSGLEKADATQQECLEAYGKAMFEAGRSNSGPKYKLVESNFVKALRLGYIVEIQEISRIKDPGVLVGLNEYNRPNAVVPLVDGTNIRRHPRALVMYTDNVGYKSCKEIDGSVIRRMAFVIDSRTMSKEKVLSRVKYNTGYTDDVMLEKLYKVWAHIGEFCASVDITSGSVSVTELENWVTCVMLDGGNAYENCIECVIAKASSDMDEQEEIKRTCLATSELLGL